MRILVIGYGSMGRRRIRIIKKIYENVDVVCVDSSEERCCDAREEGYEIYKSLDEALDKEVDCAFVCTSPGKHSLIISKLIDRRINTFTELNLVDDDYEDMIERANKNKTKVFMSSTMLYDKQIISIKKEVNKIKKESSINYIYHVGQYLPDWHPWESYKDFFISNKKTNGCREILAIQLPWIIDTFGKIKSIFKVRKKSSNLDIDYDDTYFLQITHENGTVGVFICDVVTRKSVTYLEIFAEDMYLKWNGTPDSLVKYDIQSKKMNIIESYSKTEHIEGYADNIIEDEYMDEVRAFFDWVYEGVQPKYKLEDDKYTLSIINEIEDWIE